MELGLILTTQPCDWSCSRLQRWCERRKVTLDYVELCGDFGLCGTVWWTLWQRGWTVIFCWAGGETSSETKIRWMSGTSTGLKVILGHPATHCHNFVWKIHIAPPKPAYSYILWSRSQDWNWMWIVWSAIIVLLYTLPLNGKLCRIHSTETNAKEIDAGSHEMQKRRWCIWRKRLEAVYMTRH